MDVDSGASFEDNTSPLIQANSRSFLDFVELTWRERKLFRLVGAHLIVMRWKGWNGLRLHGDENRHTLVDCRHREWETTLGAFSLTNEIDCANVKGISTMIDLVKRSQFYSVHLLIESERWRMANAVQRLSFHLNVTFSNGYGMGNFIGGTSRGRVLVDERPVFSLMKYLLLLLNLTWPWRSFLSLSSCLKFIDKEKEPSFVFPLVDRAREGENQISETFVRCHLLLLYLERSFSCFSLRRLHRQKTSRARWKQARRGEARRSLASVLFASVRCDLCW